MRQRSWIAAAAAVAGTVAAAVAGAGVAPVFAADLTVTITNARNAAGTMLVAVCDEPNFLDGQCAKTLKVKAQTTPLRVVIPGLPPGRWAVQVIHDENDNFDFDRNFFGIPTEGYGFSNNPRGSFGPPDFDDAAITVSRQPLALTVELYYW